MAAIFFAPLYVLVNLYIVRWIFLWTGSCSTFFQSIGFRIVFSGIYLVFSTSLLTGFLVKKPAPLRRVLKIMGNYFLGSFLYIFIVILTADIGRYILQNSFHLSWLKTRSTFVLCGGICTVLIVVISLYGFFHGSKIKTSTYQISIDKKPPNISNLKIAFFADCHFGYSTGLLQAKKICRKISQEHPDLICIGGDIFDNEYEAIRHPEKIQKVLASMQSRYGTYACWGNHDLSEPILAGFTFPQNPDTLLDPRMKIFVEKSNIHILEDEVLLIDHSFYLAGRMDPDFARKTSRNRKTPAQLIKDLDRSKPVIILDHQPKELQELAEAGADLDLCGHTHDGQMFPGNIITRLFWKNSCGYLQKGSMHNIVTSGTGIWGPAMRIGTNSEICIIEISFRN